MKCVQYKDGEIRRVNEDLASSLVAKGWKFIPKDMWKKSPGTSWIKSNSQPNPTSEAKTHRKNMKLTSGRNK